MPQRLKCLNDNQKFEKSSEKTVSRDCKWISLNAPRPKIPLTFKNKSCFLYLPYLLSYLNIHHPNGSPTNHVSSIYLVNCSLSTSINHSHDPTNLVSSIYSIYWPISTIITQMVVQPILFPLSTLFTGPSPHLPMLSP